MPAGSTTGARSGNRVPNVPAVTASLGVQLRVPGAALRVGGEFLARASYQYVGARAADAANSFDLRAYDVVNARLGWEGSVVELYGFAYNLLDARYDAFGQSYGVSTPTVRVGQGRILGLGTTLRF